MNKIYIDGAARGNPGPAGIGVLIEEKGKVIKEIAEYIGKTTNNAAEYTALVRALQEALSLGLKKVEVYSDSELLVKQVNGEYRVKNEGLVPLAHLAAKLIAKFASFTIEHIPREKNKQADDLANRGIDDPHTKDLPLFS